MTLKVSSESRGMFRHRQRMALSMAGLVMAAMTLTACGDPARDLQVGTVGTVKGFAGGIAAEEPRAALVGRNVLSAGGSAADAAVAMGFTLAVTLPSSAGLGGGGVCVVHDRTAKVTEVLDFMPPPLSASVVGLPAGAQGTPVALPALPRGLFALHAKYGRMRWEEVVTPSETIARFGEPMSRALAMELQEAGRAISRDPLAARVFGTPQGALLKEGDKVVQTDLAAVLGRLRQGGPGDLYGGVLGRNYVEAVRTVGGLITLQALRDWTPSWVKPQTREIGNETLYTPPGPAENGNFAALWDAAASGSVPAAKGPIPTKAGSTGFVVADRSGSSVACALTMVAPFGAGRTVPGFGMFLTLPADGDMMTPLAAGLLINDKVNEFRYGLAGGGLGAPEQAARVAVTLEGREASIEAALPPVVNAPSGPGRIVGLTCPLGLPPYPASCRVAVDSRGAGYGLLIGKEK